MATSTTKDPDRCKAAVAGGGLLGALGGLLASAAVVVAVGATGGLALGLVVLAGVAGAGAGGLQQYGSADSCSKK